MRLRYASGLSAREIEEEVAELKEASMQEGRERVEEEMGDLLFSISQLARKMGIDAESALRTANEKFTRRFDALQAVLEERGRSVHEATMDEMQGAWEAVKRQ